MAEVSSGVWYSFAQTGEISILKGNLTFNSSGIWVGGAITDVVIQNKLGLPVIEFKGIFLDAATNKYLSQINAVLDRQWTVLRVLTSGDDFINGSKGNDTFYSGDGSNVIEGSTGVDKVWYPGDKGDYKFISGQLNTVQVQRSNGLDTLKNVERLIFMNSSLAIDISDKILGDGTAGIAAKVLGAVFGKSALTNKDFVGICLDLLEKGMSYDSLAGLALGAARATTNDQIVTTLWTNLVASAPTNADKAPYIKMLEDGMAPGTLARIAADTSINAININLIGLAQTGIEYTQVN